MRDQTRRDARGGTSQFASPQARFLSSHRTLSARLPCIWSRWDRTCRYWVEATGIPEPGTHEPGKSKLQPSTCSTNKINRVHEFFDIALKISEADTIERLVLRTLVHNHNRERDLTRSQRFPMLAYRQSKRFTDAALDAVSPRSDTVPLVHIHCDQEGARFISTAQMIELQEFSFEDRALRSDQSKGFSSSKGFKEPHR